MDKLAPPEVGGASYLNNNAIVRLVGALRQSRRFQQSRRLSPKIIT